MEIVRAATMRDYQECLRLFLQAHNENDQFSLAPDKLHWMLTRFLNPDAIPEDDPGLRGIIGVIGREGGLEAICGLCISDLWYTYDKHLTDFLVFVDPEYRTTGHAKTLTGWMKTQADIIGMPLMSAVVTNHRTEAKCRLFRRTFPKVGELFLYYPGSLTAGSSLSRTAH
jgi:GNAT superfamily N-acetyltransferase